MIFERKKYLDELIAGRGNGLVKIITGVRRCGKSFLLFEIWHNWLLEHGVTDSHIIAQGFFYQERVFQIVNVLFYSVSFYGYPL